MDNPETQTTLGTHDTGRINVRENRRRNQEWTIQRHRQHWVHKTQDEVKETTTHNTEIYKDEQHGSDKKTVSEPRRPGRVSSSCLL